MRSLFQLLLLCSLMASAGAAQIGKPPLAPPVDEGAENALRGGTRFGRAVLALPDLDEDGTPEFAVGGFFSGLSGLKTRSPAPARVGRRRS